MNINPGPNMQAKRKGESRVQLDRMSITQGKGSRKVSSGLYLPKLGKSKKSVAGLHNEGAERGHCIKTIPLEPNIAEIQALLSPSPSQIIEGLSNPWAGLDRRRESIVERRRYSFVSPLKGTHSKMSSADLKGVRRASVAIIARGEITGAQDSSVKTALMEKDDDSTASSKLSGQSKQLRSHKKEPTKETSSRESLKGDDWSEKSSHASRDSDRARREPKHQSSRAADEGSKSSREKEMKTSVAPDDEDDQRVKRKHRKHERTDEVEETDAGKRKHRKGSFSDDEDDQNVKRKHRKHDHTNEEEETDSGKRKHRRGSFADDEDDEDDEDVKRKHRKHDQTDADEDADSVKRKREKGEYTGSDEAGARGVRKGHKEHGSADKVDIILTLMDKDSYENMQKKKLLKKLTSSESLRDKDSYENMQKKKLLKKRTSSESLLEGGESKIKKKGKSKATAGPVSGEYSSQSVTKKTAKKSKSLDSEQVSQSNSEESTSEETSGSGAQSDKKDSKGKKVKKQPPRRKSSLQSKKTKKITKMIKETPKADTYKDPKRFLLPEIPGVEYNRKKFVGWDLGTKREQTSAINLPDATDTATDVIENLLNKPRKSMYDLLFKSRANANYRAAAKDQEGREVAVKPPKALRTYPGFYAVSKPIYQYFHGRKQQRLKREAAADTTAPFTGIAETPTWSEQSVSAGKAFLLIEYTDKRESVVGLEVLPPIAQGELISPTRIHADSGIGLGSSRHTSLKTSGKPPSTISKTSGKPPSSEETFSSHDQFDLKTPSISREAKFSTQEKTQVDIQATRETLGRDWLSPEDARQVDSMSSKEKLDSLLEEVSLDSRRTRTGPSNEDEAYEFTDGLELLFNMQGPCANFFNVTRPDLVSMSYAARQGIEELLSFLMYAVVMNRPHNPVDFIIDLMRSIRRLMALKQESAKRIQDDIAYRVCKGAVSGVTPSSMVRAQEMDILGQTFTPAGAAGHDISSVGPLLDIGGFPINMFWSSNEALKKFKML